MNSERTYESTLGIIFDDKFTFHKLPISICIALVDTNSRSQL